jgi:GntR family transcriptional regulator/MocR family aminotransferase
MRHIYLDRRNASIESIRQVLPKLTIVNADAGMHLTAWLPTAFDDQAVVSQAAARGVSATALSPCNARKTRPPGLILRFGGADEMAIKRAAQTLATIL